MGMLVSRRAGRGARLVTAVCLMVVCVAVLRLAPAALAGPAPETTSVTVAPLDAPGLSAPPRTPLDWAQRLIQHLRLVNTAYRHTNTVVTWAGVNEATQYTSYTDCSGLLNALLTQAYGLTASDFDQWLHTRRPLAKDYYAAILAQNGFSRVRRIHTVRPGDIIAIRYLNSAPGDNTGHLMLITGAPQLRVASAPLVHGTTQWDVPIIDSSESGHGPTDTRYLGHGQFHDGTGAGVLRLYVNAQSSIVGYTWSDLSASVYYDQATRPLVIGRLSGR